MDDKKQENAHGDKKKDNTNGKGNTLNQMNLKHEHQQSMGPPRGGPREVQGVQQADNKTQDIIPTMHENVKRQRKLQRQYAN